MMARSHVVVGGVSWILLAPSFGFPALQPLPIALAAASALLPDIDHPGSWVGRRTRPVSTMLSALLGHRGITHSLAALAALTWLTLHGGYRHVTVAAIGIGYLSHLLADMVTPRGLRLFWPLRRTWAIPLCRTGSAAEPVIVGALVTWTAYRHGWLAGPLHLLARAWRATF